MDGKLKQHWTEAETQCFLALWSSTEVQSKLEGASRTKPVYEQILREVAVVGHDRTLDQLMNKLKKLKKDYRDQKRELGRSGSGRCKPGPHFEVLDSVLGHRPSSQATGALNSATAHQEFADESIVQAAELSGLLEEEDLPQCSSPGPSRSSPAPSTSSSSTTNSRKRKRGGNEMLDYFKFSDKQFLEEAAKDRAQRDKDREMESVERAKDREVTAAMVGTLQTTSSSIVSLMGQLIEKLDRNGQK